MAELSRLAKNHMMHLALSHVWFVNVMLMRFMVLARIHGHGGKVNTAKLMILSKLNRIAVVCGKTILST